MAREGSKTCSKKQFVALLKKYKGFQTSVAEALGVSRQAVSARIQRDPAIKAEYEAIMEAQIDFVESRLLQNISNGDTTACIFFLKCKAKKRGYVERQEITGDDGAALPVAAVSVFNGCSPEQIAVEVKKLADEI